jgi:hypothetical protein
VLQLLASHAVPEVEAAIRFCQQRGLVNAEAIAVRVQTIAERGATGAAVAVGDEPNRFPVVQVPRVDLSRFNQLLNQGDLCNA